MTKLEIQVANISASENRITDVQIAREMTEFTKNNLLGQTIANAMAQVNPINRVALSLLG